jgi:PhoH-like ATPase
MTNKIYVIDTSACLTDSSCIYNYADHDVVIPMKVLEEIDNHKKRQDSVGSNARGIIRKLDALRKEGSLHAGVSLGENKGTLRVIIGNPENLPIGFNNSDPDHVIMGVAWQLQNSDSEKEIILVSRDINMRVMTDSLGIKSEEYIENKVVNEELGLYTGFKEIELSEIEIDAFYKDGYLIAAEEEITDLGVLSNDSVMLKSEYNEKKTALCRYKNGKYIKVRDYTKKGVWGVRARNKEQAFAFDLLMDKNIPLVSLVGTAGSGKTLMAIAAAIAQTINDPLDPSEELYKKIVLSRPVQPMGKDIGYLPGTMEEKMHPWLMPLQDNLQFLLGNDQATLEEYMDNGVIEIEALAYIRGRSISNAFIIIDEAQNLSLHEIKTILTRVGENTKIVLTGDIEQIDNVYVNETSNGLVHAVEKFKAYDLAGHITLQKGERSALATLASKIM